MRSNVVARPEELFTQLIYNNLAENKKVLTTISKNLENCEEFDFSVAFISESGLISLKNIFDSVRDKGIKGRIITSTYLSFNSPKMFRKLLDEFDKGKHPKSNIEVRIYSKENGNFHPKGYVFRNGQETKALVGSSNLTQNALSVNQEWNVYFNSFSNEEITNQISSEFESQWKDSVPLTSKYIDAYEKEYQEAPKQRVATNRAVTAIYLNEMQVSALESLA